MVHALQRIHAALVGGGLVVDTQPVSPQPQILASGRRPVGRLDMTEWGHTVEAVDAQIARTVEAGLYSVAQERRFVVTDSWAECAETVAGWQGTTVTDELAARIVAARPPLMVDQEVRLRLLRANA